jgi:hypothetical protein
MPEFYDGCDCGICERARQDAHDDMETEYEYFCNECSAGIDPDWDRYHYCAHCDVRLCSDCECDCASVDENDLHNEQIILPYNYTPPLWVPKPIGLSTNSIPSMGIELEIGGYRDRVVDMVREIAPTREHIFMKDDGSIEGVEIVSHPQTLDYSKQFPYADLLELMRTDGKFITPGYGLHVHVNRNAFRRRVHPQFSSTGYHGTARTDNVAGINTPATHALAWLLFIYRNKDGLQLMARRRANRWCTFRPQRPGELRAKAHRPVQEDRYSAVNTNGAHTYELRFPQSTLSLGEFNATVELVHASVEYTRQIKACDILHGSGLTWAHFIEWATTKESTYPNMLSESDRHNVPTVQKSIKRKTWQFCANPCECECSACFNHGRHDDCRYITTRMRNARRHNIAIDPNTFN